MSDNNQTDGIYENEAMIGDVFVPHWEQRMELPTYLEQIAGEMRRGEYTTSVEACLLTVDKGTRFITIHRWGEQQGLLSAETMAEIAAHTNGNKGQS